MFNKTLTQEKFSFGKHRFYYVGHLQSEGVLTVPTPGFANVASPSPAKSAGVRGHTTGGKASGGQKKKEERKGGRGRKRGERKPKLYH